MDEWDEYGTEGRFIGAGVSSASDRPVEPYVPDREVAAGAAEYDPFVGIDSEYAAAFVEDDPDEVDGSSIVFDAADIDYKLKIEAIRQRCANDRLFFAREILGMEPEPWQEDVLIALDTGETKLSIRSGNGAGKTCVCAIIGLHYGLFMEDVKVVITSPSSSQLRDGLIPETFKWIRRLPQWLRSDLHISRDRIGRGAKKATDEVGSNFISFRTARKEQPEALQGIHATHVLCIVDEASGVEENVYTAAQGTMSTKGAIFILIGNPTRLNGYFYNTHHRLKGIWWTSHVTSFDTSRVDESFVDLIEKTYGKDSDEYRVKVLGEFPKSDQNTLISREWCEAAKNREIATLWNQPVIVGVDVGRGGDHSSLVVRIGMSFVYAKMWNYADTMPTVGEIKKFCDAFPLPIESINVDAIGIGAGVADRLMELDLPAIAVNVSETKSVTGNHPRLRDQLWWDLRRFFADDTSKILVSPAFSDSKIQEGDARWAAMLGPFYGMSREYAELLITEASTPLSKPTSAGKDGVESKDQMKARGYKSPNLADAACNTFAFESAIIAGRAVSHSSSANKPLAVDTSFIH